MKLLKNKKFLIVASMVLMVAMVASMGVMTYAKYVSTTDFEAQQATAAKWGYVVTADTSKLFGTDYVWDSTKNGAVVTTGDGVAVKASAVAEGNRGSVVAPGTKGEMTITVNGIAEVLAKLSFIAGDTTELGITTMDGTPVNYFPIKWTATKTIDGATSNVANASSVQVTDLVAALAADTATPLAPGTELSVVYTISWEWAFEGDNVKDTLIGFAASGDLEYSEIQNLLTPDGTAKYGDLLTQAEYEAIETTISLDFSVKLEQILSNN